jgi:large subunit ribosomal protein L16
MANPSLYIRRTQPNQLLSLVKHLRIRNDGDLVSSTKPLYIAHRGLKEYPIPQSFKDVEMPERPKLKFVDKVPQYPTGIRPPKMQKHLDWMRGPELVHNKFIHKQYGIIATCPGRMKWCHFEMARMLIARKIDEKRMFAIWRLDAPWQAVTKKGQGKRMGGGKGPIDHYVTPIKTGRVLIEMGGYCEFEEVRPIFKDLSARLPFDTLICDNQQLEQLYKDEEEKERLNQNPYSFKYVIQNHMGGVQYWMSPYDRLWYGKHR